MTFNKMTHLRCGLQTIVIVAAVSWMPRANCQSCSRFVDNCYVCVPNSPDCQLCYNAYLLHPNGRCVQTCDPSQVTIPGRIVPGAEAYGLVFGECVEASTGSPVTPAPTTLSPTTVSPTRDPTEVPQPSEVPTRAPTNAPAPTTPAPSTIPTVPQPTLAPRPGSKSPTFAPTTSPTIRGNRVCDLKETQSNSLEFEPMCPDGTFAFDVVRNGSFVHDYIPQKNELDGPQVIGSRCCQAGFDPANPIESMCGSKLVSRGYHCEFERRTLRFLPGTSTAWPLSCEDDSWNPTLYRAWVAANAPNADPVLGTGPRTLDGSVGANPGCTAEYIVKFKDDLGLQNESLDQLPDTATSLSLLPFLDSTVVPAGFFPEGLSFDQQRRLLMSLPKGCIYFPSFPVLGRYWYNDLCIQPQGGDATMCQEVENERRTTGNYIPQGINASHVPKIICDIYKQDSFCESTAECKKCTDCILRPVDVVMIVDGSSSLGSDAWVSVKQFISAYIQGAKDRVTDSGVVTIDNRAFRLGLIVFGDDAEVVFNMTQYDINEDELLSYFRLAGDCGTLARTNCTNNAQCALNGNGACVVSATYCISLTNRASCLAGAACLWNSTSQTCSNRRILPVSPVPDMQETIDGLLRPYGSTRTDYAIDLAIDMFQNTPENLEQRSQIMYYEREESGRWFQSSDARNWTSEDLRRILVLITDGRTTSPFRFTSAIQRLKDWQLRTRSKLVRLGLGINPENDLLFDVNRLNTELQEFVSLTGDPVLDDLLIIGGETENVSISRVRSNVEAQDIGQTLDWMGRYFCSPPVCQQSSQYQYSGCSAFQNIKCKGLNPCRTQEFHSSSTHVYEPNIQYIEIDKTDFTDYICRDVTTHAPGPGMYIQVNATTTSDTVFESCPDEYWQPTAYGFCPPNNSSIPHGCKCAEKRSGFIITCSNFTVSSNSLVEAEVELSGCRDPQELKYAFTRDNIVLAEGNISVGSSSNESLLTTSGGDEEFAIVSARITRTNIVDEVEVLVELGVRDSQGIVGSQTAVLSVKSPVINQCGLDGTTLSGLPCIPWTVCLPSYYEVDVPTSSSDRTCASYSPTSLPSASPTMTPTVSPTTSGPTQSPTASPTTTQPTFTPTGTPTDVPTRMPTVSSPTNSPTFTPTTSIPTVSPTSAPTGSIPTTAPTQSPTSSEPTSSPTTSPTSNVPTSAPSVSPTTSPSLDCCDDSEYTAAPPTLTTARLCTRLTTCSSSEFESTPPLSCYKNNVSIAVDGIVSVPSSPVFCGETIRTFVTSTNFVPFLLLVPPSTTNTRVTLSTCNSSVIDPDFCFDNKYVDDDPNDESNAAGSCSYRHPMIDTFIIYGKAEVAEFVLPSSSSWESHNLQIGTFTDVTGVVEMIVACEPTTELFTPMPIEPHPQCNGSRSAAPDQSHCDCKRFLSDRTCQQLSRCSSGYFESIPSTATTDRVCSPILPCSPELYEAAPATSTTDRLCLLPRCCTFSEFMVSNYTATSDRVCQALSQCTIEESPPSDCYLTHPHFGRESGHNSIVSEPGSTVFCGDTIRVFVKNSIFVPFALLLPDIQTRVWITTCNSSVRDPDLCINDKYFDDDPVYPSSPAQFPGNCSYRHPDLAGFNFNMLGEHFSLVLENGLHALNVGTYAGTGIVQVDISCSASSNGTAQVSGNQQQFTRAPSRAGDSCPTDRVTPIPPNPCDCVRYTSDRTCSVYAPTNMMTTTTPTQAPTVSPSTSTASTLATASTFASPTPCPRSCETCTASGACQTCRSSRLLVSGGCYQLVSCRRRRIEYGRGMGQSCRCINSHCHHCMKTVDGDTCRRCRDGWYFLNSDCIASCPANMTSVGVNLFGRRCLEPLTCQSSSIVTMTVSFGCKCATDDLSRVAACHRCECRAGEYCQHCVRCRSDTFLHQNRCISSCNGINGSIEYIPGSYGRECRPPFTCTNGLDTNGIACKCARQDRIAGCTSCYWGFNGTYCLV